MKKIFFLLVAACALYSCGESSGPKGADVVFNLDSVKAAIDANNKVFSEAIKNGDSLAFIGTYTSDGCVMPSNTPKLCGAKGVGDFYSWTRQMGAGELSFVVGEVTGGKDLVSEEGTYDVKGKDGVSMEKGKYLVTWKQENGQWKKYRDIWNSDAPPQPMPVVKK